MRRMGSESGRWNPLPPEQHLFPVTHPHIELTKAQHRGLAWCQLKTVDRFKGEDHPQARTEQARDSRGDLTAKDFAEDLALDLSNACKILDELDDFGFIRRDNDGVIYLTADRLGQPAANRKPRGAGSFQKPVPEYINAHLKGLSEDQQRLFLTEWYGAEQWAEDANAQAYLAIYKRKIERQAELCKNRLGVELKTLSKGKPRSKSPGGPTERPVIVQLQFVLDPDSKEFLNTSWRESTETSSAGSQKPHSEFPEGDASFYSSRANSERGELAQNAGEGGEGKATAKPNSETSETAEADPQIGQEVDELIQYRVAAARLEKLGGKLLDPATIRNLRTHLLRLPGAVERRQVLALIEDKCRHLARHPEQAAEKTWGWVVGMVKGEVNRMLEESGAADVSPQGIREAARKKRF